jgi:copper chaperone CopZ
MKKVTYLVPGINCMHCVHTIKTELSEIPGVKVVEGDPSTKKIQIEFEDPANEEAIINLLGEINYPVQK